MPGAELASAQQARPSLTVPAEPLISVVMPVYNAKAYLADSVASIQAQSHSRWELVIVDDGSRDGSAGVASQQAAHDDRIRTFTVPHGGVAAALNAGISSARGEIVARMDADDIAAPERFAIQLDWMRKTGAEICGSWAVWFGDEAGSWWAPVSHQAVALHLAVNPGLVHPTVMMHAEIARLHPYHPDFACEDFELWTRLVGRYRMGSVPAVLLKHRRHTRQVSKLAAAKIRSDANVCRRRGFDMIFPDADDALVSAYQRMVDRRPCGDAEELTRVGELLVRLAQCPEHALRERMLRHWRAACLRAARLGPVAYRNYLRFAPEFAVADFDDPALEAACTARLRSPLSLKRGLRHLLG
jgi:glycosyltransferase involved in cell wall biosynthesis